MSYPRDTQAAAIRCGSATAVVGGSQSFPPLIHHCPVSRKEQESLQDSGGHEAELSEYIRPGLPLRREVIEESRHGTVGVRLGVSLFVVVAVPAEVSLTEDRQSLGANGERNATDGKESRIGIIIMVASRDRGPRPEKHPLGFRLSWKDKG